MTSFYQIGHIASGLCLAPLSRVLLEVEAERVQQDAKWGVQSHPLGAGEPWYVSKRDYAIKDVDEAAQNGSITWGLILREEHYEAMAEGDPQKCRAELIQVAAVAVAMIEYIDRSANSG